MTAVTASPGGLITDGSVHPGRAGRRGDLRRVDHRPVRADPPAEGTRSGSRWSVAGLLPDIDPRTVASGPETQVLDRIVVLALLTAADALADAGIEVGRDVDPDRIGVIVGGVGGMATLEQQVARPDRARGRAAVSPYLLHRDPAEHGRGPDRHRARHPRLQLVGRHRLRLRRPGGRRRGCG